MLVHNNNLLELSSRRLRLVVDPACGGKMRSLVSRRNGGEFFYQDKPRSLDSDKGYIYHDISGGDECFPTVAPCRGITPAGDPYDYADHGSLWQNAWQILEHGSALLMTCHVAPLNCTFTRRCAFETDDTLRLDYHIANQGDKPIPYIYSMHPLLAANEQTRVVLPKGLVRAFNYVAADNFGLPNGEWFDLPIKHPADLFGPFALGRQTYIKLFSDRLAEGWAAVEYPDRSERLVFTFDTANLPYVGFLASQGFDSSGDGLFANDFLLAFEPTTGIGDDLPTCIRTNTLQVLAPGAAVSFWIRLTVESM